jgi:hypothetical protein
LNTPVSSIERPDIRSYPSKVGSWRVELACPEGEAR